MARKLSSEMAVTNLMTNELQDYKCDANGAVCLKLVKDVRDVEDEANVFKPVMSHQIFGSSETIFGYKGLQIELFYTAARLATYVNVKYEDVIDPKEHDGLKADDVLRSVAKQIPSGFYTNKSDFISALDKERHFKPFGEQIHSYSRTIDGKTRCFELYKNTIEAPGFKDYHERLQTFLLWYVDAASYIDVDDDRWTFYLVYERYRADDGDILYSIVGYQTVYAYFSYPDRTRLRVSQVLILPPYQRMGHGAEMLQAFYRECWADDTIVDITVEDPSVDYQRMRDFVDVKNCLRADCFSSQSLSRGFTAELVQEARKRLKLNRKQCRRIYEIIKYKYITPQTLRDYRLEVKARLYQPFLQSRKEMKRLKQALESEEFEATKSLTQEQKLQYLESSYQECVDDYRHVLEKVASASTPSIA